MIITAEKSKEIEEKLQQLQRLNQPIIDKPNVIVVGHGIPIEHINTTIHGSLQMAIVDTQDKLKQLYEAHRKMSKKS